MNKKWNYVDRDGQPEKEGVYWVTVIYDEWKNEEKTGRRLACVTSRLRADLDKNPDLKGWTMDGEPDTGLAWTEEVGSVKGEKVYAWMPLDDPDIADLPEGVEIDEE